MSVMIVSPWLSIWVWAGACAGDAAAVSAHVDAALILVVTGGLSCIIGVAFCVRERQRYFRAIWHLFVLAGSTFHYFAVLFCILPGPDSV